MARTIDLNELVRFSERQKEAMQYVGRGYKIMYGGSRGGGKSFLMLWAAVFACLHHEGLSACIIRSTYQELEKNFIREFLASVPGDLFNYKSDKHSAFFFNGSTLDFVSIEKKKDVKKIKGINFALMCVDEVNEFDSDIITYIRGSNRNFKNNNFSPTFLCTANPGGVSDEYIQKYFGTPIIGASGEYLGHTPPMYAAWNEKELKQKDRFAFVRATVDDNPNEVAREEYKDELETLPDELRRAWLHGDWNTFSGQAFRSFNERVHVIEPFFDTPPEGWEIVAGLDIGYSQKHPTVCLWGTQDPKNGNVYIFREYAGSGATRAHIDAIKALIPTEEYERTRFFADPSMFGSEGKRQEYESESDAKMFINEGIVLEYADNERIAGWRMLRQWLDWSPSYEPKIYFFRSCEELVSSLPKLRYSNGKRGQKREDIDTTQRDDAADALRYLLMGGVFEYWYHDKKEDDSLETIFERRERLRTNEGLFSAWNTYAAPIEREKKYYVSIDDEYTPLSYTRFAANFE